MTKELAYHESEWAVRRWDWFNKGRIVKPKSFCQFWRTVVLYATVKWLLALVFFPVRPAFHRAVTAGESLETFGVRHKKGMERTGKGLIIFVVALYASFIIVAAIVELGAWGLVGLGAGVAVALAGYGITRAGVLGLLWQAAVAAKHGICPPVEIVREA